MKYLKTPAMMATTCLLVACGGGSSEATYREQVDTLLTLQQDSDLVVATTPAQLPDTGSATYSGIAIVAAETDPTNENVELSLIGNTSVTANFANGTISGRASNFRGATIETLPNAPEPNTVDDIDFGAIDETDYAGTLTIAGTINGATAEANGTFTGRLTGAGNTVVVDSTGAGVFGGSDAKYFGLESEDTVRVNGADVPGFAGVITEKD